MSARADDTLTTLAALKARILAFAEERDWLQFHSPKNLSMAIAAESGELLECFLWKPEGETRTLDALSARERSAVRDEIADVLIYTLELANVLQLDLATIVEEKMAQNAAKYPVEKAKGKALKYTDL